MNTVEAYEAKKHWGDLLKQVIAGQSFIITRHGIPVAHLCPVPPQPDQKVAEAIREIRRFREKHTPSGLNVREMINEGRK